MRVPKTWWWVVAIAVPLLVAIIAIVPDMLPNGTRGGDTFVVAGTQFNGDVTFNSVTVVTGQLQEMSSQELPDTELETLREALKLVKSGEFDKAIPLLELVADTAPVPALLNNIGGAYMAIGRVEEARSYFEKALIDNSGQGTAARSNLDQIIGPTQLSEFAGVEAEVTRFEDTGGMITLEVTFRNVSANNVKFWVSPSEAYLLDEQTATKWSSVQSSDSIPENYLALTLNPGDIHLIWMKFRVGDAEPAQFTAVVPAVPRPFNRLVLD